MLGVYRQRGQALTIALLLAVTGCARPGVSATPAASSGVPASSQPSSPTAMPQGSFRLTPLASLPPVESISRLAGTPDGFLAMGIATIHGESRPTLLDGSADGSTWAALDLSGVGEVFGFAAGPSGQLLGVWNDADPEGQIYRSDDGSTWSPLDLHSELAPMGSHFQTITAGGAGFSLVAPGEQAWTSVDGRAWSLVPPLPDDQVDTVVVRDNAFIAYQSGLYGSRAGMLVSSDGHTWSLAQLPAAIADHGAILNTNETAGGLIALVCMSREWHHCGPDTPLEVWRLELHPTADGVTALWQEEVAASEQFLGYAATTATSASGQLTVLGYDMTTMQATVWTTGDGASWTRKALSSDVFGGGVPSLLAAGVGGFVTLGFSEPTLAGTGRAFWRSTDGLSWTPVSEPLVPPSPAVPQGECPPQPTTVAALMAIGEIKAAACYGSQPLTLRGYSSDCGGCGGVFGAHGVPEWMTWPFAPWYLGEPPGDESQGRHIGAWLSPSAHLAPPPAGTPVIVTGHYSDPASDSCRLIPDLLPSDLLPAADSIARCQRSFVVTSISTSE